MIKHGSLSKTAEKLGVPIATISRQIAELEKSLQINSLTAKNQALNQQWRHKNSMRKWICPLIIC
ncbi:LysR family transcriptional regulator [Moraxella bovis]|uniref:helix-turn-helix domain-containing protein n=1 Tax=Moraxella bovis TaxID=476 RepID=UPI001ABEEC5D|nr:LysR family transcriptional regulator [Moraxella bovis]UYZ80710.1 LysR family transcriptional regulator [Moraxella bovis]UZA06714.1 LysR family transcriptional regulator [Moraxella bovis]UZA11058.1 LysR family transcriptional regulator [Moraxella bovis]UZA16168.1 LysR family transcriptional regulator [Moraxella bovis]